MSNNSDDSGDPIEVRNLRILPIHLPPPTPYHEGGFIQINLELMDPENPGQQLNADGAQDALEVAGPMPGQPRPVFFRLKSTCRAIGGPFSRGFKIAERKMKQHGDDTVGWKRTVFILLTEQIGLALGLAPFVYNELGYIGATLTYLAAAGLGSYTNMALFGFKRDHGEVTSICDIARIISGGAGGILSLVLLTLCATVSRSSPSQTTCYMHANTSYR